MFYPVRFGNSNNSGHISEDQIDKALERFKRKKTRETQPIKLNLNGPPTDEINLNNQRNLPAVEQLNPLPAMVPSDISVVIAQTSQMLYRFESPTEEQVKAAKEAVMEAARRARKKGKAVIVVEAPAGFDPTTQNDSMAIQLSGLPAEIYNCIPGLDTSEFPAEISRKYKKLRQQMLTFLAVVTYLSAKYTGEIPREAKQPKPDDTKAALLNLSVLDTSSQYLLPAVVPLPPEMGKLYSQINSLKLEEVQQSPAFKALPGKGQEHIQTSFSELKDDALNFITATAHLLEKNPPERKKKEEAL